jgi:hypothetical protein
MPNLKNSKSFTFRRNIVRPAAIALSVLFPVSIQSAGAQTKVDPKVYMAELYRLGAHKPFLTDSPDVYLEPRSLNRFFTEPIYKKLWGNVYFGYRYDEGFIHEGTEIQIEILKDLTPGAICSAAYRLALGQALSAAGLQIKTAAPYQIGVCIIGIEDKETNKTLPGVMVESFFRNALQKKSFFIRFGAGSPRGLVAAIRLSAEMLVSELETRRKTHERNR